MLSVSHYGDHSMATLFFCLPMEPTTDIAALRVLLWSTQHGCPIELHMGLYFSISCLPVFMLKLLSLPLGLILRMLFIST